MEILLSTLFIGVLAFCVYLVYQKPKVNKESIKTMDSSEGIQELAKLFILTDDTITYVANNHPEYYAKKQIDKRQKAFDKNKKNYIYDSIVQSESNNKVMAACCDASGDFNPDYAGNLGVIFTKLKIIIQLSLDDSLTKQRDNLDKYVYVKKNFNELNLLYTILNKPIYSYYLTKHTVDELNSISHCLDRLISLYNGYEPNFEELETVPYGTSIRKVTDNDANSRQLQYLESELSYN